MLMQVILGSQFRTFCYSCSLYLFSLRFPNNLAFTKECLHPSISNYARLKICFSTMFILVLYLDMSVICL